MMVCYSTLLPAEHFSSAHVCVLMAPLYWTTSKWLPAARGQSASIVLKFPGFKWGTHASLWHSNLALLPWRLLTCSNRRAADRRPFLDSFCDRFSCVCLPLTSSARYYFLMWFILPFVPQPDRGKKVKLERVETGKKKSIMAAVSAAEIACMCLLECVFA